MMHEFTQAIAMQAVHDRYAQALATNAQCVVCNQRITTITGALLLERSQRLAHPGACTVKALRMEFVHAHASRTGLRAMRRRIA
jgi:hypothetical protein